MEIAEILKNKYHDFAHYNLKEPLDELMFVILSTMTEEKSYRNSFRALRVRKNIKVTITLPEGVGNSSTHHGRRAERG